MIRPGREEDIEAVLALWGAERSSHAVTEDTPEALLRALPALLVACDGEEVVGAVLAADDLWRGNFYRLAVAPSHRRRGIGLALVRAGEQRLRVPRITALVAFDDAGARAFWRAAGYAADPVMGRMVRSI